MATVLQPVSQKQFKVVMDGQTVLFQKVTAPSITFDEAEYNDGETGQTLTYTGFMKVDKVTCTANYDPTKHAAFLAWFQDTYQKAPAPVTITISVVQNDVAGTPLAGAKTMTLTGCKITKFSYPSVDRESNGLAKIEMEIAPTSARVG